ncbi:hypothetical protein [Caenibius sp. WL]|uniref:hypothetical protein n=1 Tax=Caenibius sp. WL TaxID=2872646 RepID=UPI001C9A1F8E|nr:hypothetical protein [Caenibius sp. WL]QZP07609.1 hypothetical protein K5X80_13200 [Caenibius sp. WL]
MNGAFVRMAGKLQTPGFARKARHSAAGQVPERKQERSAELSRPLIAAAAFCDLSGWEAALPTNAFSVDRAPYLEHALDI